MFSEKDNDDGATPVSSQSSSSDERQSTPGSDSEIENRSNASNQVGEKILRRNESEVFLSRVKAPPVWNLLSH